VCWARGVASDQKGRFGGRNSWTANCAADKSPRCSLSHSGPHPRRSIPRTLSDNTTSNSNSDRISLVLLGCNFGCTFGRSGQFRLYTKLIRNVAWYSQGCSTIAMLGIPSICYSIHRSSVVICNRHISVIILELQAFHQLCMFCRLSMHPWKSLNCCCCGSLTAPLFSSTDVSCPG